MFKKLVIVSFIFFCSVRQAKAQIIVDCKDMGKPVCASNSDSPLFSDQDGQWYPGRSLAKTITFINSGKTEQEMALRLSNKSPAVPSLSFNISIVNNQSGKLTWAGSLEELFRQDRVRLGLFPPKSSANYLFTATLDPQAGNEYQSRSIVFDLDMGYWVEPTSTPTPTPTKTPTPSITPTPTKTPSVSPSRPPSSTPTPTVTPLPKLLNSASEIVSPHLKTAEVLGAQTSSSQCAAPEYPPLFLSIRPVINGLVLSWGPVIGSATYVRINFGIDPAAATYYNPNVSANTSGYSIYRLNGGKSLCFTLQAGNSCGTSPVSPQICSVPLGKNLGYTLPPTDFYGQVLGASDVKVNESNEGNGLIPLIMQFRQADPATTKTFVIFALFFFPLWILLMLANELKNRVKKRD